MSRGALGKDYRDGELIIRQGELGEQMFVVQDGSVDVFRMDGGKEVLLAELGPGACFGEMAIFERETRSASVRARGAARVLTVDRRTLMRRLQKDPSLALRILETMSHRIRVLDAEVVRLRGETPRRSANRVAAREPGSPARGRSEQIHE